MLLLIVTAEERLAAFVSPAQLTVQPFRIAARLFQRRDERRTSRRWREARRPSPSPHHEHTAHTRNPKSGTPAGMGYPVKCEVMHTLARLACAKCAFPTLGI